MTARARRARCGPSGRRQAESRSSLARRAEKLSGRNRGGRAPSSSGVELKRRSPPPPSPPTASRRLAAAMLELSEMDEPHRLFDLGLGGALRGSFEAGLVDSDRELVLALFEVRVALVLDARQLFHQG